MVESYTQPASRGELGQSNVLLVPAPGALELEGARYFFITRINVSAQENLCGVQSDQSLCGFRGYAGDHHHGNTATVRCPRSSCVRHLCTVGLHSRSYKP